MMALFVAAQILVVSAVQQVGDERHNPTAAKPTATRAAFVGEPRCPEFVRIPTTTFLMGSPITEKSNKAYREEELPQRKVTVKSFGIGRFLVTAEEFCLFLNDAGNNGYMIDEPRRSKFCTIVNANGKYVPREFANRCPATMVTWRGADAYAAWLARDTGLPIRLPSESEWEVAARGEELREYPWGDEKPLVVREQKPLLPSLFKEDPSVTLIYREDLAGKAVPLNDFHFGGPPRTSPAQPWPQAPVGSYPRNVTPEGVYDMAGYWYGRWCSDVYNPSAYEDHDSDKQERKVDEQTLRVQRGMAEVPISGNGIAFLAKQDRLGLRLILPMGDARADLQTRGRTWSRVGKHPLSDTGMVRLAIAIGADEK